MATTNVSQKGHLGSVPLRPSSTFVRIRGTSHAALNGAVRLGLLERNSALLVAVWTVRQTAEFLEHVRGHPMSVLYLAVALLGLRRDEATGLR